MGGGVCFILMLEKEVLANQADHPHLVCFPLASSPYSFCLHSENAELLCETCCELFIHLQVLTSASVLF